MHKTSTNKVKFRTYQQLVNKKIAVAIFFEMAAPIDSQKNKNKY
jgi:hypothetical protein